MSNGHRLDPDHGAGQRIAFPSHCDQKAGKMKNYPEITSDISTSLKSLRRGIPETMQAFSSLAQAATKSQALDSKTKELIALALGIAARCDGCIGFHCEALVKLGASRQELEETLGMAVYMGGGPSLMYAADALAAYEQFQAQNAKIAV